MLQIIDDKTRQVLTDGRGVEVTVMFADGSKPTVKHYAEWKNIPNEILTGNIDGKPYASLSIRDIAVATAVRGHGAAPGRTSLPVPVSQAIPAAMLAARSLPGAGDISHG